MRSSQIIRIEFFTQRLFVLCERLQNKTMSRSLYWELKVFSWLHFICFESLQKKSCFVDKFRLLYLPDILFKLHIYSKFRTAFDYYLCVYVEEKILCRLGHLSVGERKGFFRLWCLLAHVCVCLNLEVSQPLRPLSVVSC